MVAAVYTRLNATALRLVKKYGVLIPYTQLSTGGGDYDPTSGIATPTNGQNQIKRLALITDQAGNRINPKDGQILDSGTLVQGGDKWIYFVSDGPPPVLQDHCVVKGTKYTIKDVQTYGPGGIDVLYLCVIRQ